MKAMHVYENIGFERKIDPRRSLGISPDPKNQREAYLNYVIGLIPEILGLQEVPKDIIDNPPAFICPEYSRDINDYFISSLSRDYPDIISGFPEHSVDTQRALGYNIWLELKNVLLDRGYKRSDYPRSADIYSEEIDENYIQENINFKRGVDPKKALGLGIDPRNKKLFIEYLVLCLPKILGREEIPEDIIMDFGSNYINSKYGDHIDIFVLDELGVASKDIDRLIGTPFSGMEIVAKLGYNIYEALHDYLKDIGFEKN